MKETNLERIQREVFSYDTEAGYALRYHITRALACNRYNAEIGFNCGCFVPDISYLFIFGRTVEGYDYWFPLYRGILHR